MIQWLQNIFTRARMTSDPAPSGGNVWLAGRSLSNIHIDEDTALRFSAVYACVRIIAETLAHMPFRVHNELAGGGREIASTHPADRLLHRAPNPNMTPFSFREVVTAHVLTWGNGYAEIDRDANNEPRALWPIHPERVIPEITGGRLTYRVKNFGRGDTTLDGQDMLHIRGLTWDGMVGISPIRLARESIGLGLAGEKFGNTFFGNAGRPSGVLEVPSRMKQEEFDTFRKRWKDQHTGDNSNNMAILENGMKFNAITIPPEEAQFLETRKFQVGEIARWYRVPPHKIGDLDRATFSNIEQQSIEFVQDTVLPWAVRWEQEVDKKLIGGRGLNLSKFSKMNMMSILRGDQKTRFESYKIGINNGWMSPNDVRELEDLNPIPDGGDYYLQINMTTLDKIGEEPEPTQAPPPPTPPGEAQAEPDPEAGDEDEDRQGKAIGRVLADAVRRLNATAKRVIERKSTPEKIEDWLPEYRRLIVSNLAEPLAALVDLRGWQDGAQAAVDAVIDRYATRQVEAVRTAAIESSVSGAGLERLQTHGPSEACVSLVSELIAELETNNGNP